MATRAGLRWTATGMVGAGLLLAVPAMLLPWSSGDFGVFNADIRFEWGLFGGEASNGEGDSTEWDWYDERIEEDDEDLADYDGVPLIRTSIPIFFVGLALVLGGVLAMAASARSIGGVLSLIGGLLALLATILLAIGIEDFEEGTDEFVAQIMDPAAGLVFAYIATGLIIAGGLLGAIVGAGIRITVNEARPLEPSVGPPPESPPAAHAPGGPSDFRIEQRHRFR